MLFLDGMDEVPTGLKSVVEAYVMCYLRATVRVVMTSRPGGFGHAWLEQCTRVHILPLDAEQQESVAKARLRQPQHLVMWKQLMVRPDLQQLASNPLILSMFIAHIRSASKPQNTSSSGLLNRWRLYHAAMTTIITRLDAKTLEARKGQAGRSSAAYLNLLQEIAFHAHCKQMKDLNTEVLRAAITEQTSALWDDVKESVARGQFAVLTAFVENDETIYRFGHLTFQVQSNNNPLPASPPPLLPSHLTFLPTPDLPGASLLDDDQSNAKRRARAHQIYHGLLWPSQDAPRLVVVDSHSILSGGPRR